MAEDDVTIDMKSDRVALEGEVRNLGGPVQSIKGQLSHTDYMHTEFEGSTPGTVFKNKGSDFRLEARHARFGNLDGVVGFQAENNRFSADGAEAFAPYSKTSQNAVFAYEEYGISWGKLSFGGRLESVKVESLGNPLVARFAPLTRLHAPQLCARRPVEYGARLAAHNEPGLYRTGTQGLRAFRPGPSCGDQRLGNRRCNAGQGKVEKP